MDTTRPTGQQHAVEQWFLQRGLPLVLRPDRLVRGLWSRSAPALAAWAVIMAFSIVIVAVTGEHSVDIDGSPTRGEWFLLGIVALLLPGAATAGWLVSRITSRPIRRLVAAASISLVVPGVLVGGPSVSRAVNLALDVAVIALIFVCTATGIGSILGWAARMTLANLTSIGGLMVRALPVVLLTMLVFFNNPVWRMADVLDRSRLWLVLGFLYLLATAFLASSTLRRVRPILARNDYQSHARALTGTPLAALPDLENPGPLNRPERANVLLVIVISEVVQVLTVALVAGAIFLTFGLLVVSPELLADYTRGGPSDGQIFGMTLPIPDALIQVVMFLTALTYMYLAARALSDKEYRKQFLKPQLKAMRVNRVARDRYRGFLAAAGSERGAQASGAGAG
ncbi:hypothetical protein [Mycolicibacterium brumae]|uniref:hypothetical protein n=1 Tax=Mycolicibacterium brumae TaxID=85968 RepID=UPI000ACE04C9|nr:hypothetical protein [Mycolicibacterium brumae]RWA23571.1 hypothetical protein MBRU_01720 [Mycolicibacterium brumae DSM 44177]UWW08500.1 hypothetical protein L2Z93_001562 [Mycolicibacterium brumae]